MLINIKKITSNKKEYLDLLLLADPSPEMIDKYLDKSEMFVLSINGVAVSEVVVSKPDTWFSRSLLIISYITNAARFFWNSENVVHV